jgi:hypothetical protein
MSAKCEQRSRRGVLLIVILALLAMFAVMAMAFVVVSNQERRAARTNKRIDQFVDPPQQLAHQVMMQIIRGPNTKNSYSVMRAHSLLEGIYGNEWIVGQIPVGQNVSAVCGGQLFEFQFVPVQFGSQLVSIDPIPVRTGCVLTMLSGRAAGQSTYIVAATCNAVGRATAYQAVAFDSGYPYPERGDYYLINGPPFSGMGLGYNPSTGKLDAYNQNGWPVALLPNLPLSFYNASNNPDCNPLGGANKDYDAIDYQTMLLGAVFTDHNSGKVTGVIPSLHRPDLIYYWLRKNGLNPGDYTSSTNPNFIMLRRLICLRPDRADHPLFPGNDPQLLPFNPVWFNVIPLDVDNDGDGVPDSIWVDFGLPVRTLSDGRLYKPMVAVLCLDLNGRLDLNAHGNLAQTYPEYYGLPATPAVEIPGAPPLAGGLQSAALPRGRGYGPADINLLPLFLNVGQTPNDGTFRAYRTLLCGEPNPAIFNPNPYLNDPITGRKQVVAGIEGRYGELTRTLEFQGFGMPGPGPGLTSYPSSNPAYVDPILDPLSSNKLFEYWPANPLTIFSKAWATYWGFLGMGPYPANYRSDSYGNPPDFQGSGAVGLDTTGHPLYMDLLYPRSGGFNPNNNPYEINLSLNAPRGLTGYVNLPFLGNAYKGMGIPDFYPPGLSEGFFMLNNQYQANIPSFIVPDNPFSAAELEPILRPFDVDALTLNSRLLALQLKYTDMPLTLRRQEITTDTWNVPVPSTALPWALRRQSSINFRPRHVTDILRALNVPAGYWPQLLPLELLSGQKMDINRPFGNGRDDNGNGVVDDPDEMASNFQEPLTLFRAIDYTYNSNDPLNVLPSIYGSNKAGSIFPTGVVTGYPLNSITNPSIRFNRYNGDNYSNPFGVDIPQQLQTRYLYVLMMLLSDLQALDSRFNGTTGEKREQTCRFLAQWAVNAVDFRDRDSISTRFSYTVNPFSSAGWNPDGNHVVWGCERPELLLTETLAFHDRRTEDLEDPGHKTTDSDPANRDKDFDSKKRPQGSLFIEIYNPQSPLDPPAGEFYGGAPTTLSNWNRGNESLGAGVLGNGHGFKLNDIVDVSWNLAGSYGNPPVAQSRNGMVISSLSNNTVTVSGGTSGSSLPLPAQLAPNNPAITIRAAYNNGGIKNAGVRLDRKTPQGHPVWRMIVVRTKSASEQPDPDDPIAASRPDIERSIYFTSPSVSGFNPSDDGGHRYYPDSNLPVAPLLPGRYAVAGSGEGSGTGPFATTIGLRQDNDKDKTRRIILTPSADPNVSQVDVRDNKLDGGSDFDASINPPIVNTQSAIAVVINQPRRLSVSEPVDGYPDKDEKGVSHTYSSTTGEYSPPFDRTLDSAALRPKIDGNDDPDVAALQTNGTTTDFRILHLQRLANPLAAYNENLNPYLTVDSMPVDLTAFNGATSAVDPEVKPGTSFMFRARERGETENKRAGGDNNKPSGENNLWKQERTGKQVVEDATPKISSEHYFDYPFTHSLGYLNKCFGDPGPGNANGLNRGGPASGPFPWLTWNNRPYVSQLELLLVPILRSSKLLAVNNLNSHMYYDYYDPVRDQATLTQTLNPYAPNAANFSNVPYPHLMNFFESAAADSTGAAAQFYRILDYVGVPSPFTGTEIQANPSNASGNGHTFHPPFNKIPAYREPGRINLNTIFSPAVLFGLTNFFPGMDSMDFYHKYVVSRQGGTMQSPEYTLDQNYPTIFARPFRTFAGASLTAPVSNLIPAREIDVTLLRGGPPDATNPTSVRKPLFNFESTRPVDNANRNPFFRYEGLQRLGNLVTTHSNQFAIWITIGYFEISPWPGGSDATHPDGYQLGKEIGSDTGEIVRHRAFYIFDRTIPVGFQRGQDVNAEKAILVKRFIE